MDQSTVTMDDYRREIITQVREHSFLWDPFDQSYKNKARRKQAWRDIESRAKPPPGTNVNAKLTWDQLTRSFSNALRRTEKRSSSGVHKDKKWRFEKDMMFLLPAKKFRHDTGATPVKDSDFVTRYAASDTQDSNQSENHITESSTDNHITESSTENHITENRIVESSTENHIIESRTVKEEEEHSETSSEAGQENMNAVEVPKLQKSKRKRGATNEDDIGTVISLIKQRQIEKSKDPPRFNFFRSIMPAIECLDEDQFLNLQIDILKAIQKQRLAGQEPARYQQPA